MKTGVELIAEERQRQIEVEGWTAEHDDEEYTGALAIAGACYALDICGYHNVAISCWEWPHKWWKPTPGNPIRQLVKAGALIAAEIDRLQRVEAEKGEQQ